MNMEASVCGAAAAIGIMRSWDTRASCRGTNMAHVLVCESAVTYILGLSWKIDKEQAQGERREKGKDGEEAMKTEGGEGKRRMTRKKRRER